MKPVLIEFKDEKGNVTKTFSTCSLKTGLMDNMFDILEVAKKFEAGELEVTEIRAFFKNIKAVVVEVFGGQFTYDDLNKNVEQEDVIKVFQQLCSNLMGSMVAKAKK